MSAREAAVWASRARSTGAARRSVPVGPGRPERDAGRCVAAGTPGGSLGSHRPVWAAGATTTQAPQS
eukprot:8132042-Lingulodinium_polyedra.AAC.1